MSTEQHEPNALAARLSGFWNNFRQGKVISYRWMAITLILVSVIGVTWYIFSERRAAASLRWMEEDEANSQEKLEKLSEKYPGTIQDKLARLQIARQLLSESGMQILSASPSSEQGKSISNIETAREMFRKLLDDFKNDPIIKAECLLGLAKSEAALVAVPSTPGQLIEFKGKIPTVVEYLDRLSEAAAPGTPWATDSKKLADSIRNEQSASADDFKRIQRALFDLKTTGTELR